LLHNTKHSLIYLEYLEKYIIHATIHSTKLDELSYRNFKRALLNVDIEAVKVTNENKYTRVHHTFKQLIRDAKNIDMFKLLSTDLKDTTKLFRDDFEGSNSSSKFKGSPVPGGVFDIFIRK
jgi:hypothetical protein